MNVYNDTDRFLVKMLLAASTLEEFFSKKGGTLWSGLREGFVQENPSLMFRIYHFVCIGNFIHCDIFKMTCFRSKNLGESVDKFTSLKLHELFFLDM